MVGTLQRFAHPFQARHVINTNRSKMATAADAAFVNCVCPHEMAVYTNTRTMESFYLVSVPDRRCVDVLFPDEGQQVQLFNCPAASARPRGSGRQCEQ
jgi:hypothetical protein